MDKIEGPRSGMPFVSSSTSTVSIDCAKMVANPLSFPNQPVGKATSIIYSTSITQKPADLQFTMTWDSSFTSFAWVWPQVYGLHPKSWGL